MSQQEEATRTARASLLKGPIAWMAQNQVAANLLMAVLLLAGLVGVFSTKQEVFPEFSLDQVSVQVAYPGASPDEVAQGITLAVEEKVRGLDGVKRVTSVSSEGSARINVELMLDAEPQKVLADVNNEVDRITTFPKDAEEPVVSLARKRNQVIALIFSGKQELSQLHALAERARMDLLASGQVTQIEVEGVPPLEISVEVPRAQLERFGLTLEQISMEIQNASLELPAGALESDAGEIRVRVSDRRVTVAQLESLVLRGLTGGGELLLGDIAHVRDGYQDNNQYSLFNGEPAVRLTAYRVGAETPTGVADAVKTYAAELQREVGSQVALNVWQDDSKILRQRIDLLASNAGMGLVLVLLILALFLDLRLAFWVSLGIPISFLGAFLVLGGTSLSINMVTLFAFIVTLGMVVDDAIVVGERTYFFRAKGHEPLEAAVMAAKEMAAPITFAILTTVAAFAPLLFVPGVMGKIFKLIPTVVIAVLLISLVESFFVLPAHLAHSKSSRIPRRGALGVFRRLQEALRGGLETFTQRVYRPVAVWAVRYRYITLALSVASLVLTGGAVASGRVPFNFFPQIDGDVVTVSARLPYGAPLERTEGVGRHLEETLAQTAREFGGEELLQGVYTRVGLTSPQRGPGAAGEQSGSHLIEIQASLPDPDERTFSPDAFLSAWRSRAGELTGVESLNYSAASGPSSGAAVSLQLVGMDETLLARSAADVSAWLRARPELTNVNNGYATGKPQMDFKLKDEARGLGFSAWLVAAQLRSALFGSEAVREQRGRHELKIMTRLPESERRNEHDLEAMVIRNALGHFVPLSRVASVQRSVAPTSIDREDGRRKVVVSAELARGVASSRPVLDAVDAELLGRLREQYPSLAVELVGQQREQAETFSALGRGYLLALLAIFALLAIPFRSYIQPLVIMAVIPFGFVGAIVGHALMGYSLSLMSMFGLVALSGVVVNDSLVLVDAINKARAAGRSTWDSILEGGVTRLRPILLTSLTTFFGLVPMLAETSMQARFLIPMAISLAFGVLAATVIVLLLVPALYMITEDLVGLFGRKREPGEASSLEAPTTAEPSEPPLLTASE